MKTNVFAYTVVGNIGKIKSRVSTYVGRDDSECKDVIFYHVYTDQLKAADIMNLTNVFHGSYILNALDLTTVCADIPGRDFNILQENFFKSSNPFDREDIISEYMDKYPDRMYTFDIEGNAHYGVTDNTKSIGNPIFIVDSGNWYDAAKMLMQDMKEEYTYDQDRDPDDIQDLKERLRYEAEASSGRI